MKAFLGYLTGLALLSAVLLTGCYDKPGPGTAQISVVDTAGVAQAGVFVRLFCTEKDCAIDTTGITDSRGELKYNADLPMVLRIRAVRYDSTEVVTGPPASPVVTITVDSMCGEGFVTIRNDETSAESITILECK